MKRTTSTACVLLAILVAACGDDGGHAAVDAAMPIDGSGSGGNRAQVLADVSVTTAEDTPATQAIGATDPDGDAITFAFGTAAHGTVSEASGSLTYTPAANYNGTDTFTVTASDGTLMTMANVTVTITPVNDAPVAVADSLAAGTEDTADAIPVAMLLGNDTDVDGDTLTVTAVSLPHHGTATLATGVVTFTPDANFNGAADFTYTVSDGTLTATALATISFTAVNDAPVAVDDAASTPQDTALVLAGSVLLANDTDADGNTLSVQSVSNGTHGTVALAGTTITFTPTAGFIGTDAGFDYVVTDGTATDTGHVTVNVTKVDHAPVATDDAAASTPEDTALVIDDATLLANDTDPDAGDTLSITAVATGTHGTVTHDGATHKVTFTPAADFHGTAQFDYTVSDGTLTDTGTVFVTVTSVNDAPVAVDDAKTTMTGANAVFTTASLLANDTDVDGDTLTITAVGNPTNCTVSLTGNTIQFTSASTTTATFEYTVSDGTLTDTGLVTVTLSATAVCGDGAITSPETCDDLNKTAGDGCNSSCKVETGWTCTTAPSTCSPICHDGLIVGTEQCDDSNTADGDGCSSKCVVEAPTCTAAGHATGTTFALDPATGHCYFDVAGAKTTYVDAETACVAEGGHLVTLANATEQAVVAPLLGTDTPWIGAKDDANTTDSVFVWVTGETYNTAFEPFATNEPDNDSGVGGNGDCLHFATATSGGQWGDTNCNVSTFVSGRVCEIDSPRLVTFQFLGSLGTEATWTADQLASFGLAPAPVMSRGAGETGSSGSVGAFSGNSWPTAAALGDTQFFSFTVTPATSDKLTLSSVTIDEKSSASGPATMALRSSADNFTTDLKTWTLDPTATNPKTFSTTLTGFTALTTATEFRIYGYGGTGASGTMRVDNVGVNGIVVLP